MELKGTPLQVTRCGYDKWCLGQTQGILLSGSKAISRVDGIVLRKISAGL